jgi:hypothetical protein
MTEKCLAKCGRASRKIRIVLFYNWFGSSLEAVLRNRGWWRVPGSIGSSFGLAAARKQRDQENEDW